MCSLKGDIMECKVYKLNELKEYKYVVILSKYQGKILLSRHKKRSTWETQGGHIEKGETPLEAAKRELFEESGAVKFSILPVFDYWAGDDISRANGMVFMADITELSDIPNSEMKEVQTFCNLPDSLTYPKITPVLFDNAKKFF
ncbi:MAG TPA: NUDIX domain-containing protein [Clostridium sp.]|uniref:NUDIX hydrolase n=1 Tax=Clostridium sp. TaxID=1506 RepID=UPI002F928BE2